MDVQKKLDEIVDTVGNARSMPMSASCVINRAELLAMLEEVRAALPDSLAQAQDVIGGRERMVEEARQEAERIIQSAHAHRGSLVSDTEVARKSQEEADRILEEARREAEEIRAEADDYVDSKLANFEVVLTKTIGSVDRGREKMLGRAVGGEQDGAAGQLEDGPERSADPQLLQQRADEYVDTKLGAVSAVLSKTLEAVGRGRQKLLGARAIDELGAHLAAQDAATPLGHQASDDDYLADLAQSQAQLSTARPEAAPDASYYAATAGYQQQDAYGYQQQGYVQQQDPYAAAQGGYQQQDAYGWQQQPQGYDPSGYAPEQQSPQQSPLQPQQQLEHQPHQPQQQPQLPAAALDETSLFDTSMIDLDQLRQYEQGR